MGALAKRGIKCTWDDDASDNPGTTDEGSCIGNSVDLPVTFVATSQDMDTFIKSALSLGCGRSSVRSETAIRGETWLAQGVTAASIPLVAKATGWPTIRFSC